MVFSTDNILKQENIIDNTPSNNIIIKVSENSSLFINALHYIIEENLLLENELAKYNISTYTNKKLLWLQEDNIVSSILKNKVNDKASSGGFSTFINKVKTNLTIENIVKFIITSFIKLITRIWREFEVICMSLVSKDSQIKRLSSKIKTIGVGITYDRPMFTYTHILDDTNRTDLEEQLDSIYNELMGFLNQFKSVNSNNMTDVENIMSKFNQSLSDDEDYYAEIRGQLLGTNSFIFEEDFNEALFKYFRNSVSEATSDNIISPESIRERLNKWEKMPRIIKSYTRDQEKLKKAGTKLEERVRSSKIDSYIKEVNTTVLDLYSNLVNRYAHKIKNTCNIFLMFYSHKLDAAKEELKLNKDILFEVCKYITREGL